MADFWAYRKGSTLVPDRADSAAEMAKVPFGKLLRVEVKRPRNGPQHRLYWGLCKRISEALGIASETVSDMLKIETGHCDIVHSKKYGEIRLPRSISFARMDQEEFSKFFDLAVIVIHETWGIARADVLEAVSDLLEPKDKAA